MPPGQSIVEDVRTLLTATQQGSVSQSQFESKRTALLLAAEAEIIQRREMLSSGLAAGTITGMQAADTRADLQRAEKELREAASLVGISAAQKSPEESKGAGPGLKSSSANPTTLSGLGVDDTLSRDRSQRVRPPRSVSRERPEVGPLARRVGSVLPTALGAMIFAPLGLMTVMGKLEGWAPVWGLAMLLMALACVLTARERWENPDPT